MARWRRAPSAVCPSCGQADSTRTNGTRYQCKRCEADFTPGEQQEVATLDPIPPARVESMHKALLASKAPLAYLTETRGVPLKTVKRHRLGLDRGEVVVPVPGRNAEEWVYIKHALPKKGEKLRVPPGARATLYPWGTWPGAPRTLLIAAGEWDCLVARGLGYHAFTSTTGEGTWYSEWALALAPHASAIVIAYDADDAGRSGARKVALSFREVGFRGPIKAITWPVAGQDLSDWVLAGHGLADLRALIKRTPRWTEKPPAPKVNRTIIEADLYAAGQAKNAGRYCRFPALILAATTEAWQIPKQIQLACQVDQQTLCRKCSMPEYPQPRVEPLDLDSPEVLRFMGEDRARVNKLILTELSIPPTCPSLSITDVEALNVHGARLTETYHAESERDPTDVLAYSFAGELTSNREYTLTARTLSHPKTQERVAVVHTIEPSRTDLSTFRPDRKLLAPLVRRTKEVQPWMDKMLEDASRVTGVVERPDLHAAVLIAYHTPRWMQWGGQRVRGWADMLILGDSSQGKTTVTRAFIAATGLGERHAMKRSSEAGLIGGIDEHRGRAWLKWGLLPRANDRLLVLEEIKALPTKLIAKMTDARSEGVAEVAMLRGAGKTACRTRLLMVSNARWDKSVREYDYGVSGVVELIGAMEDVRRLDLAIIMATREVEHRRAVKAQQRAPKVPHASLRESILRAWAMDAVKIPAAVQRRAERCAEAMIAVYHSSIPLVEPMDHRFKLGRLACGVAAWQQQPVGVQHVEWVAEWMDRVYSGNVHGYRAYSEDIRSHDRIDNAGEILSLLGITGGSPIPAIRLLLRCTVLGRDDIFDAVKGDHLSAQSLQSALVLGGAVERRGRVYQKTEAFVHLLKGWLTEYEETKP